VLTNHKEKLMNILQRSDDWYAERCGKVTASRVKDLNAKPSKGKALNALGLTILAERLTGVQKETQQILQCNGELITNLMQSQHMKMRQVFC
jgi:hypothetical protein